MYAYSSGSSLFFIVNNLKVGKKKITKNYLHKPYQTLEIFKKKDALDSGNEQ